MSLATGQKVRRGSQVATVTKVEKDTVTIKHHDGKEQKLPSHSFVQVDPAAAKSFADAAGSYALRFTWVIDQQSA